MKTMSIFSALAAALLVQAVSPDMAHAQPGNRDRDRWEHRDHDNRRDRWDRDDRRWRGDRNDGWDPAAHYSGRRGGDRRLGRNDHIYRGGDGRYYCKRKDGTTGLVIGGVAGGLLGNAIGGNTLGTLLGAGGGALLGRQIDRGSVKCR